MASRAVLDVLEKAQGGSSGKGTSYWTQVAICSRASRLYREHGEPFAQRDAADIGVLLHALLEAHHTQGLDKDELATCLSMFPAGSPEEQALHMALAYVTRRNPTYFGEVLACEKLIPSTDTEQNIITEVFDAGKDYTARIDMAVRMDEETCHRLQDEHQVLLDGPGLYIVDHKSHKAIDPNAQTNAQLSLQFLAYTLIWNATQSEPCRGLIENNVVRHKVMTNKSFYLAFRKSQPTDLLMLRRWVRWAQAQEDADVPNLAACRGKFGPCAYYTNNLCSRM